jgi:hypothetical protein
MSLWLRTHLDPADTVYTYDLSITKELVVGLEPTTCGLRNRCSTTELHQHLFSIKNIEKK